MRNSNKNSESNARAACGEEGVAMREFLTKVGDKWTILVVVSLSQAPGCRARFSALEKVIPVISQRMLTLTLRNLERDGLITRELFPEVPPRVEYELTGLGKSLLEPTQALLDWVGNNWVDIKKARGKFDVRAIKGG
ncbi:MAG: Transcriptional regulator, HxlR family protein [Gammaproteobacteria bacterium]|jgi:DNA-binding HxlR family transcriptional regulator|nr:Transcriptional regulator, HxlR family protein [Gammaproteobacteria bacterium]